jgi:hypothetical protein
MRSSVNFLPAMVATLIVSAIIGCISDRSAYAGPAAFGSGTNSREINGPGLSTGQQGSPGVTLGYTLVQYPSQYPQQQSPQGAAAEQAFRRNLMMHSMGFGGIFGPALKKWVNTPSKADRCADYTEFAAKQACKAGDGWAADRLRDHQSTPEEKDWYDR